MHKKLKEIERRREEQWEKRRAYRKQELTTEGVRRACFNNQKLTHKLRRQCESYKLAKLRPVKSRKRKHSQRPVSREALASDTSLAVLKVKFCNDSDVRFAFNQLRTNDKSFNTKLKELRQQGFTWQRAVNKFPESRLQQIKRDGELNTGYEKPDISKLFVLYIPDNADITDAYNSLIEWDEIDYVEFHVPDVLAQLPPDYFSGTSYRQTNSYGSSRNYGLNILAAWEKTRGAGVKACVYEYLVVSNHINLNLTEIYDPEYERDLGEDEDDYTGHGTACAGIIGATNNAWNTSDPWGVVGIAHEAEQYFYRYQWPTTLSSVVPALIDSYGFGEGDVMSISMSTGSVVDEVDHSVPYDSSGTRRDGVELALANGICICLSAGNQSCDLGEISQYFDDDPWREGFLGAFLSAACDSNLNLQSYSSYSEYGDGVDNAVCFAAKAPVVTPGYGSLWGEDHGENYHYRSDFAGTSSAAPQVAGVIALLQSYCKEKLGHALTPEEIRDILFETGTDTSFKARIPDADAALSYIDTEYLGEEEEEEEEEDEQEYEDPGHTLDPGEELDPDQPVQDWGQYNYFLPLLPVWHSLPDTMVNLVCESVDFSGPGEVPLNGSPIDGFMGFADKFSPEEVFRYAIMDEPNGYSEVGIGVYKGSPSPSIVRFYVERSSNSNMVVNFPPGEKRVYPVFSAQLIRDTFHQHPVRDLVHERSSTTGDGDFVLDGPISGHYSFAGSIEDGQTVGYCILDVENDDSEVGYGILHGGTSPRLERQYVEQSTNDDLRVMFKEGRKDVFHVLSEEMFVAAVQGGEMPHGGQDISYIERPVILEPEDGQSGVGTPLILESSEFITSDNLGGSHRSSSWAVRTEDGRTVHEVLNTSDHLTQLEVPTSLLVPNTRYRAQVRYHGDFGLTSEWSESSMFTMTSELHDASALMAAALTHTPHLALYSIADDVFIETEVDNVSIDRYGWRVQFSENGKFLVVSGTSDGDAPYRVNLINCESELYYRVLTEDESTLYGSAATISPDETVLAIARSGDDQDYGRDWRLVSLYKIVGSNTLEPYPLIDTLESRTTGTDISFSHDNRFIAVTHNSEPYLAVLQNDKPDFTRVPLPGLNLPGTARCVRFFPNFSRFLVGHSGSPYLTLFNKDDDYFEAAAPCDEPPSGSVTSIDITDSRDFIVVTSVNSPSVLIYQLRDGVLHRLSAPGLDIPGRAISAAFSSNLEYLAVAHRESPYVTVFKCESTGTALSFTKIENPGLGFAGTVNSVAFS